MDDTLKTKVQLLEEMTDLREKAERLDFIIEGTNVGTWDWYVQTGETVFNEKWAEIVGYTLEELEPVTIKTWVQLAHPDDLAESNRLLEKHIAGELDYYDFECRVKHKNGTWVWVHDRGKLVQWDDEGRPYRMSGTHTDITERKRAEDSLRRVNEILDRFFEHQQVLVAYLDSDFNFIRVNRAYALNGKREPEDFTGKNHFDLYPDEDNYRIFKNVVETGEVYSTQAKPFHHPDQPDRGTTYWDWSLAPVRDSNGNVEGLVLVLSDVSEREKMAQELQEKEKKYRNLIEDMPVLVCRFTEDGTLTFTNSAYDRCFGGEGSTLTGQNLYKFIPASELERVKRKIRLLCEESPVITYEHRVVTSDGSTRWYKWVDRAILDEGGKITEYQSTGIDITDMLVQSTTVERQHEVFTEVLQHVPIGILLTDDKDRIRFVNDVFLSMTGYSRKGLLGNCISSYMKRQMFKKQKKRRITDKYLKEEFADFLRPDSTELATRTICMFLDNPYQPEYNYAYFVTDVSFQKKLDVKQVRLQSQIESIIRELDELNESFEDSLMLKNIRIRELPEFDEIEKCILRYIEDGATNALIAKKMELAEITIKKRVSKIYTRLGIENRYQLIEYLKTTYLK